MVIIVHYLASLRTEQELNEQFRFLRVGCIGGDGDAITDLLAAEYRLDLGETLEIKLDGYTVVNCLLCWRAQVEAVG